MTTAISKRELKNELYKRASSFVISDEREIFTMDDLVKIDHCKPLTRKVLHTVEFRVDDLIHHTVLCPICEPLSDHEIGAEVIYNLLKKREDVFRLEKDIIEINDQVLDFLVNNRYVVHYTDLTYFRNFTDKIRDLELIEEEFKDEEDYELIEITFKDMANIERVIRNLNFE